MAEKRIIKKYPNRRLYDTVDSKYITLEDIRRLVFAQKSFVVKDMKTDEDLTRSILLQIIIEQEHDGTPLFSSEALAHIIRFYEDSIQSVAADFLQKSVALFVSQQHALQKQLHNVSANPMVTMATITEKNLAMWQKVQDDFFKSALNTSMMGRFFDESQDIEER